VTSSLKRFKRKAFARPGVKVAYEELAEEFAFLDEVLRARAEAGLTQAEVAKRIGTTQSAVARLESATSGHSPSIASLQRYAKALGCHVEVRLVKDGRPERSTGWVGTSRLAQRRLRPPVG
jgi:transcriptional regulator with XRE-family HTH domain